MLASLSSRCSDLLRSRDWALLFDLENNVGSSKAAAKQVAEGDSDELRGRQPTSALSAVFLMGLEIWKHIVIQFRSKAQIFRNYQHIITSYGKRSENPNQHQFRHPTAAIFQIRKISQKKETSNPKIPNPN